MTTLPGWAPNAALSVATWNVYSPEQLLGKVRDLIIRHELEFGESDIPDFPQGVRLNPGEIVLPCIYLPDKNGETGVRRTVRMLCRGEVPPLMLAPGASWQPGIRWIGLDPNAYLGAKYQQARQWADEDGRQLVTTEGLMVKELCEDFRTWRNARIRYSVGQGNLLVESGAVSYLHCSGGANGSIIGDREWLGAPTAWATTWEL